MAQRLQHGSNLPPEQFLKGQGRRRYLSSHREVGGVILHKKLATDQHDGSKCERQHRARKLMDFAVHFDPTVAKAFEHKRCVET